MHFSSGRPRLSSLGIGIALYAGGTAFAAAVTTHAVWRVGTVVLQQLVSAADAQRGPGLAALTPAAGAAVAAPAVRQQSVRREAAMTPLADRWDGRWGGTSARPQQPRVWGSAAALFGTSARNAYRPF